jgi:hypothetical protein
MRHVNFAAAVDDILLLIRTGRVNMATTLLEGLVDHFDDVVEQIADHTYEEGRHDMAAEIRRKKRRAAAAQKSPRGKSRKHAAKPVAGRVHDRQPTRVVGGP